MYSLYFTVNVYFWINGCVVKDVCKQNECTMKGFEGKTGCITSLDFRTERLENSSHTCEKSTKAKQCTN